MTLMKSILLGSAAGIVAVAGAQAADLPTKKAAPAEYVRICNVGGMAGFIIPGSDTCLKISGYITGQIEAGNITTNYTHPAGTAGTAAYGFTLTRNAGNLRPSFGFSTRANIDFDARTNTAYGVLRGYAEIQFDSSAGANGFDTIGPLAYINLAYVQWAGITAGKAPSFFAFFGGGEAWANIFSPDQQGFNQPQVLAYTATFGGGFSATIAIQDPAGNASGGGSNNNGALVDVTRFGMTAPDVVANVRVDQSWGSAQISGVAHQVHVFENLGGIAALGGASPTQNVWGYAFGGGVSFNLPSFGAGDKIAIQGDYSKNATIYSGLPDGMWDGTPNDNGLAPNFGDTYWAAVGPLGGPALGPAGAFATPTAWSIGATMEHHFSPIFSIDPEGSYGELHWSNNQGQLPTNTTMFIIGAVAHWDPVPQLDFALELLYENIHQDTPANWLAPPPGGFVNGVFQKPYPANNSDGVAGRFYITRNF
jgi:hypothetical protein